MPSDATTPIDYTGQFRHGVDAKKRLTIPSDWRSGEEEVVYVRLHSTGSHVTVLPPAQLRKMVAAIEARKDKTVAEQQKLIRAVSSGAQRCCVDKQGRMVLPPEFCAKAGLQGEVMLVGSFGQFEIWNTERWIAEQSAVEAESQDLANELGL